MSTSSSDLSSANSSSSSSMWLLEELRVPEGWEAFWTLLRTKHQEEWQKLNEFLILNQSVGLDIYPPSHHIFEAFYCIRPEQVKVVILGQDPYHGPNQAHGLSFSVLKGNPIPPSLRTIYKNLQHHNEHYVIPTHGELTKWARQGVLMLNSSLTVQAGKPNSHQSYWIFWTTALMQWINEHLNQIVFILWGNYAIGKQSYLDANRHLILTGIHPSPLAHRGGGMHPFLSLTHFQDCNAYLESIGKEPIDWQIEAL